MRLRSGNASRDASNRVDLVHGDGNLSRVKIPDLNLLDESDPISIEEGGAELNRIERKSNGSVCENEADVGVECEGMEVENDEALEGLKSSDIGISWASSSKAGGFSGVLHPLENVAVEAERLKEKGCVSSAALVKNSGNVEENVVCLDEEKGLKEKGLECTVGVGQEGFCRPGLVTGDKAVDGDSCSTVSVNGNSERQEEILDHDPDLSRIQLSNIGEVKECSEKKSVREGSRGKFGESLEEEAKGGRVIVVGKVLRSRVVPGDRWTDEAAGIILSASPNRRKKGNDGRKDVDAILKSDANKLAGDSMMRCNSVRTKRATDLPEREVVKLNKTPLVSEMDDGYSNDNSVRSSVVNRNRGRPKKSMDPSAEQTSHLNEVQAVSEVEDDNKNCRSSPSLRKAELGERGAFDCPEEDHEVSKVENAAGNASIKSVGSSTATRRSERSKRVVDYCEKDAVQRKKVSSIKVDDDDEVEGSAAGASSRKRGRPKKHWGYDAGKKVSSIKVVDDSENGNEVEGSAAGASSRKRGRPKKEWGDDAGKKVSSIKVNDESENGNEVECTAAGASLRKRGRPKKDWGVNAVRKESSIKVGDDSENGNEVEGRAAGASSRKRGRPKKEWGDDAGKEVSSIKVNDESENGNEVEGTAAVASSRKRGRPKKEWGENAGKMISQDKNCKIKVPVVTASNGGLSLKEVSSVTKRMPGRPGRTVGTSKCEDTSLTEEQNGDGAPQSPSAEKNAIRNQIVDMLLRAGWTIQHRPRAGRLYNDAVYVSPAGRTHWSVTKAYKSLQREFDQGKFPDFTPLPNEVLSRLFRVVSKIRSDKNKKKKHKGDGDSSSEEDTRDGNGNKIKSKRKHSVLKSKSSVKGGSQSKRRIALVARRSKGLNSECNDATAHSGKDSVLAWMIDSGVLSLGGKVHYRNRPKTKAILEGSITRDGIHCQCCKEVVSVSEFEEHAGSKLCEPYENLYLESGQSLLQCLLDSWNKQESAGRMGYHSVNVDDPNDDTCAICGDGGDLMCCDGCPSTFHQDCLEMEEVPLGEWHCVYCSCKFCGTVGDAIDDSDTASLLVSCCLCEKKYHESCIDEEDVVHGESGCPTFCDKNCQQIYHQLRRLIGVKCDLEDGYSWTLLQRSDFNSAEAVSLLAQEIRNNSKLAVALAVMDECFVPIIDPRSGINLIRHVVYNCGSNFNRLNFSSFYTFVLEKGDEVICAASVRIHGKQLAEMPFIGTRNAYRRQGMCRRLLTAIEQALASLDIQHLVIPAISDLLNTWTSVFGFQAIEDAVKEDMGTMNILVFAHTAMLQKPLSKHGLGAESDVAILEADANCLKSSDEPLSCGVDMSEVDDSCVNGPFDLNVVASGIAESSSDERHANCISENCGDTEKSRVYFQEMDVSDKVDAQPFANNGDNQVENKRNSGAMPKLDSCSPVENGPECGENFTAVENTFGERTLNPDLNLTGDDLPGKSELCKMETIRVGEHMQRDFFCSSVPRVISETSCNKSSVTSKSSATGLFDGNGVPKVGSN